MLHFHTPDIKLTKTSFECCFNVLEKAKFKLPTGILKKYNDSAFCPVILEQFHYSTFNRYFNHMYDLVTQYTATILNIIHITSLYKFGFDSQWF